MDKINEGFFAQQNTSNSNQQVILVKKHLDELANKLLSKGTLDNDEWQTLINYDKPIVPVTNENIADICHEFIMSDKKHLTSSLNWLDVSNVTNTTFLFASKGRFNCDLSKWDTHNIVTACGMFEGCSHFNSDISEWDMSSCKDMSQMFAKCKRFNQDISKWDVSSATNMRMMLWGCENFTCDISDWEIPENT